MSLDCSHSQALRELEGSQSEYSMRDITNHRMSGVTNYTQNREVVIQE